MYKVNRSAITTSAITTGLHMLLFTESHLMSPLWHYKFRIFYFLVELDIIGKSKYTSFQCYNSSLSVQQWLKKGRLKLSFLFETRVEVSACVQMLGASSSFCPLVDAVVAFFFFVLAFCKHGFLAIRHLMPLGWWFSPVLVLVRIEVMVLFCEKNLLGD